MNTSHKHTEEHKNSNQKTVKIDGEEKLLLFDDNDSDKNKNFLENELLEFINKIVDETFADLDEKKSLYEGWLDEADYPESFSVQYFMSLPSYKKRVQYAREHLGRLGGGSSRVVFSVDPTTVVKIATNKKGQAQNQTEAEATRVGYENIAEVKDYDDENFLYIEMERAEKLKRSDWKKITGTDFDEWMNVLKNYMKERDLPRGRGQLPVPENFEEIEETELFNNLVTMLADFDMPTGDIARVSSWGLVTRDGKKVPVLIDYGLTKTIWNDFYAPKSRQYRY